MASGKVILAGEHATVYGFPALAVGLDRGVLARVTPDPSTPVTRLRLRDLGMDVTERDDHDLARALASVLTATNTSRRGKRPSKVTPLTIEVFSSIPPGSGLGSSAALGVAITRALDPRAPEHEVLSRTMEWERVFHGEPSGLDALVAARGGCISFVRGGAPTTIEIGRGGYLCIGLSGRAASTRAVVASVAAKRAADPTATMSIFEAMGGIARRMGDALRAGDLDRVGHLMTANHVLLRRLGVSTPSLDRMCEVALSVGASGAKLTGAGGGGCAIALASTRATADAVVEAWRRELFAAFVVPIGPRMAEAKERSTPASECASI
jgi:mevalonate kinase